VNNFPKDADCSEDNEEDTDSDSSDGAYAKEQETEQGHWNTIEKKFEILQNDFLRCLTGALRWTPTIYIQIDTGLEKLSLYMRERVIAGRAALMHSDSWQTIQQAKQQVEDLARSVSMSIRNESVRVQPLEEIAQAVKDEAEELVRGKGYPKPSPSKLENLEFNEKVHKLGYKLYMKDMY
jgi:hypothetical protein